MLGCAFKDGCCISNAFRVFSRATVQLCKTPPQGFAQ
jgi:hypothetical protein